MNVKGTGFDISNLNYQWLFGVVNKTRVIPRYIKEKRKLLWHREIMKMPVFFSFIDSETCVCKNLLRSGFFVQKENTSLRSNPLF